KAVEVMCFVPKRCNDMMNVGRLQGFEGKITAQGKLLQQDTFTVTEQDSGFLSRPRERRVFLFEQIVIFSEPIDRKKGFSLPGYIFKNSIKMSCLGLEPYVDGDPARFALTSRAADGSTVRFVLHSTSVDISRSWVSDVSQILETQRNFLNALQSPIEYQRRESKSNSLGRSMKAPVSAASSLRPHSSASIDRQRVPCLRAYNTSLPTLYLPSQGPANTHTELTQEQRSMLESRLESQTVSPTHVQLAFSEEPPLSQTTLLCQTVSNGVYPPSMQSSQRKSVKRKEKRTQHRALRDTGGEPTWSRRGPIPCYLIVAVLQVGLKPLPCSAGDSKVGEDRQEDLVVHRVKGRRQRAGEGGPRAPGPSSSLQHPNNLAQLDEDDL
ncbi:hypothetical protein NFI96_034134, partial [Prochilodus magdalenae]